MNRQEMESLMKDVYDFTKYFVGLQTAGSLSHPIGSALSYYRTRSYSSNNSSFLFYLEVISYH